MKTSTYSLLFFVLWFVFSVTQRNAFSQAVWQGPNNPANVTEQYNTCLSCPGASWLNHSYAMFADGLEASVQMNSYPSCFMTTCYYARALEASNFGFTIPATSTIQGIKADVLRRASAGNTVLDTIVQLMDNNLAAGINHANLIAWPVSASYVSYGDSTDLWGITWTPAQINNTNFGVFFKPFNHNPNFSTAYVDHVRVTVYYITSTGIHEQQSSGNTFSVFYNPSGNVLQIKMNGFASSECILTVYNSMGKQLLKKKLPGNFVEDNIATGKLAAGIYFVSVRDGEKEYSKKLIIQ